MTEIIEFPVKTFETFPTNSQEAFEELNRVRKEYCDEVSQDIFESAMQAFIAHGFQVKTDVSHIKDIVFLEEAIKSMIYRYKRIPHQMQEIAETTISVNDDAKELLTGIEEEDDKVENNQQS